MTTALSHPPKVPNLPSWCKRTTVGLEIGKKVTFKEWSKSFETLEKTGRGHQWWIGDSLNEGESRFPEDYAQVLDPIEEEKRENEGRGETYRQYQQVAFRVPIRRRRQKLYFGHHQTVAYLEEEEQEHWLDLAEQEGWSVDKLRRKIKKAREGGSENDPALDLLVLQDPLIRQWLEDYKALVVHHDDELGDLIKANDLTGAKFLHRMTLAHIEHADRQLERTEATDCGLIKKALGFLITATIDVIGRCMRNRGFFMSDADLSVRLEYLTDPAVNEVRKEKAETLRHEGQKGDVVWEYKLPKANGQQAKQAEADRDDEWI